MPGAKETLLRILRDTRVLLALPDNDFAWSTWDNAAAALAELDGFIADIEAGRRFDRPKLSLRFAPTGDIQEVSVSSGWGDQFCLLAECFDSAFARYEPTGNG